MKKRKGLVTMILAGTLLFTNVVPTFAANTSNSNFEFVAGTSYTYSAARPKENSTPVYVRIDSSRPTATMQVYGYIPNSSGALTWTNCTYRSSFVTARPGINSLIKSTVYEKGGRSAKLWGKSVNSSLKTAGVWSPDSKGSYTILNP